MSATDIAEVTIKIYALDQEIRACKNELRDAGRTNVEILEHPQLSVLNQQLTALINERSVLRQQQQASAGKFLCIYLFIYFPGYLYTTHSR
jgi:hypothetical protein